MSVKSVFLSSTIEDLAKHREACYRAIEGLGCHCVRMEEFPAVDWDSLAFCQEKVSGCDVFVGILGFCYGSCPQGTDQSYTEREYQVAVDAGMPRLMFLADDDFSVPQNLIESEEERDKQLAFRQRVEDDRLYGFFSTPQDLATKVTQAFYQRAQEDEAVTRHGASALNEVVMPLAPGPPTGRAWEEPPTHDGQIVVSADDGELVGVPDGSFKMGANARWQNAFQWEKPVHAVTITHGFWLGKCQVTNAQYARFLSDVGYTIDSTGPVIDSEGCLLFDLYSEESEIEPTGNNMYRAKAGRENHPVVEVSWYGAGAYAAHYGLRLPTEAEWEYAARGPRSPRYPWGNGWDPQKCCNKYNQADDGRTFPVGSFPDGASWCEALDMVGNVWECCADWFGEDYYENSPNADPPGPNSGPGRVARGGSWYYDDDGCNTTCRHWPAQDLTNNSLGFRCAVTPES